MAKSQIKSHRIADKAIKLNHINPDFRLPEDRMNLNYPTHDNSGDLTEAQKNTLTQKGNADELHYHTGGGGGSQGIYTNEERDVQLLKLSMLINSTKYGMDKAVKDILYNDSSVYYGVKPSYAPTLDVITDDNVIGGSLSSSKIYSYGVTFNTLYGETNILNTSTITTGDGLNNAVKIKLNRVPSKNTNFNVYRCDGTTEKQVIQNEDLSEWDNPYNLDMGLEGADKTSGLSCTRISTKGYVKPDGTPSYIQHNVAEGVNKKVLAYGEQMNKILVKDAPFTYYIQIFNKADTNRIDVIWDRNPANVPLDYEIYYTTDFVDTGLDNIKWRKFQKLNKLKSVDNVPLALSTNGTIKDNYYIKGNTRPQNIFNFKTITNITCIKIVVKNLVQYCNLIDLRLYTEENTSNKLIAKTFPIVQDYSDYKTLKVDVKSNGNHNNLRLGFIKNSDNISETFEDEYYRNYVKYKSNSENLTGCTVRQKGKGHVNPTSYEQRRADSDRIRVSIVPKENEYIKLENMFLMISTQSSGYNNDASVDIDIGECIIPITWNNGLPYYENENPDGNEVWSDWAPIKIPYMIYNSYVVTFTVISGTLYCYCDAGFGITGSHYSRNAQGLESSLNWRNKCHIYKCKNYFYTNNIELGKSNSQYMKLNTFNLDKLDKWHRHYIPLPPDKGSQDIRKLIMFFENLKSDQEVLFDNISLSHSEDLMIKTITVEDEESKKTETKKVTEINTINDFNNIENIRINDMNYTESDLPPTSIAPKAIMFTFPTSLAVNKLILYFGHYDNAGKNYAIQFTNDKDAKVDDPFEKPCWMNVSNLAIGETGIPQEFTGTIMENKIYQNNIWDQPITHTFSPIVALKIRIVVFTCFNSCPLKITNVKIMTADDLSDFHKIYTSIKPAKEGQVFIDDGKPYTTIKPSNFNTSGSHNVYYDNNLRFIRLIDKTKKGVIYTKELPLSLFIHLILTAQTVGNVRFYASIDSGETFEQITLDKKHTFKKQSKSIIFKIEMLSSDAVLNAIAFLYSL